MENSALAASAGLISFAFCLLTYDRWLRRRAAHDLAWTIAMALFALGAGSLWWAESRGWSTASFRVFFLTGAILNVPWLGLGTVYLLFGQRVGHAMRTVLVLLSGIAVGVVLTAPTKRAVDPDVFPTAKELFGVGPRLFAALGSGIPAVVIIGGALWSALRIMRNRVPAATTSARRAAIHPKQLAAGNLLIALGAIVLSASGTIAGRLGKDRAFAITLLLGVSVLFAGFIVASNAVAVRKERLRLLIATSTVAQSLQQE
jgi:hypothetical protein